MTQPLSIVLCRDRTQRPEQEALLAGLAAAMKLRPEFDVTVLPHLYDLAPDGPGMRFLRSLSGPMIVLAWLYPRATFWVLNANGVRGRWGPTSSLDGPDPEGPAASRRQEGIPDRTIWCLDLRRHVQPKPYLAEIDRIAASALPPAVAVPGDRGAARIVDEATRPRWYPVLDFHCCTNCLECLNFCLFGVYSLGEGDAILVEQPDACRNGCPACSRICPAGAIMFPQHKDPGIAGDREAARKGLMLDLSQLFGGAQPAQLAAAERDRAVAEEDRGSRQRAQPQPAGAEQSDQLDRLVDGVDELDL